MRSYQRSRQWFERAKQVLAGGVSSTFRAYAQPHPLIFTHGKGARVYDVDGNEYLDYTLSQGPLILGHSHPALLERVSAEMAKGQLFGSLSELEVVAAELIQARVPCAELVRFSLSGSEADHAALRLARAATGRKKYLKFEGHYHGWLDGVAISIAPQPADAGHQIPYQPIPWTAGQPSSVLEEVIVLPWNDLAAVQQVVQADGDNVAAILTEPIMCNAGCILPQPGYLEGLRQLCNQYGIVLIFDEVITGFRVAPGGAQECFQVTPDLAVFGKALGAGFPVSVLAGRRGLMNLIAEGAVIHAGTFNAYAPGCAAMVAALELLDSNAYARLYTHGQRLMAGLAQAAQDAGHAVLVTGPGPMFHLGFTDAPVVRNYRDCLQYDTKKYGAFVSAMQDRGVRLIGRGLWYHSLAHTDEDVEQTLTLAAEAFRAIW